MSDDLVAALANPPRKAQTFRAWLADQDADRVTALQVAGRDSRWSDHALTLVLRKAGAPVTRESIIKWRAELG